MFINKECKYKSKLQLLIDIVRAEEALATLMEHGYDEEIQDSITRESLDYMGICCELQYDEDENYCIFDEFKYIIQGLYDEITLNDNIIHINKKYGYL